MGATSHHLPDRFFDFEEPLGDFLGFFIRWYLRASSLSGTAAFPGAGGSILQGTIREAQVSSQKGAFEEGWKKAKGLPIQGWETRDGVRGVHDHSWTLAFLLLLKGETQERAPAAGGLSQVGTNLGNNQKTLGKERETLM